MMNNDKNKIITKQQSILMRITLSCTALFGKLTSLSKVINPKSPLPILSNFIFEVSGTNLHLTASDNENTLETNLTLIDSDSDGSFAVQSHDFLESIKGIPEQPITLEVNLDTRMATIIYMNGRLSMPVESAEDFPDVMPMSPKASTISIPSNDLTESINRTLFAIGQDEIRPVMNGIYFDLTPNCLAIVASDGHKLVRNRIFSIKSEIPASFILPKKPATLLKGLLVKDAETEVTISIDTQHAQIDFGEGVLSCRLIEGHYPNYNSVIPQNNPNMVYVNRLGLLSALKRVHPFANDASNLVRFRLENNVIRLETDDYDFSKTATESVMCEYGGSPMSIGFKGSAFIDVLSNLESEQVILKLADPSRASVVVPAESNDDQEVLMLLMPMLIND